MNNRNHPWVILVPKKDGLVEIADLNSQQRNQLMEEISIVSEKMKKHFKADKMNVAALGNMVRQLHIHIIARYEDDPAWPKPVWAGMIQPYPQHELMEQAEELRKVLTNN